MLLIYICEIHMQAALFLNMFSSTRDGLWDKEKVYHINTENHAEVFGE